MQVVDKLMMFNIAISDMPIAKEFYGDKLGLKVVQDYRMREGNEAADHANVTKRREYR